MTNQPMSSAVPAAPLVTVIIVNYNGGEMICRCIRALEKQTFRDFAVLVVDNHSADGSVASIRNKFAFASVLEAGSNLGFAGGVNHALQKSNLGQLVALLNPDAFPDVSWLDNLVNAARSFPGYAAFGSKMYSDEARRYLDGVGDAYHVSGLPWRKGHGSQDSAQYDQPMEIFAPCAAAALYRMDALKAVGLLDEEFFLYAEDIDLGFRLRLAGFSAVYVPSASVVHVGSAFVGKHSEFQTYYGHRNLVWVYIKNMPGVLFWIFLPAHIALNFVTILWFAFHGHAQVILRSKLDALYGIPHYWRKRQRIQANRKVSILSLLRQLSWNPLARRR
jgi:GT2 family glycosyltransferase